MNQENVKMFEKILEKLDKIEQKLDQLETPYTYPNGEGPQPDVVVPNLGELQLGKMQTYDPYYGGSVVCQKCGMEWKGEVNYVCDTYDCPIQIRSWS